MSVLESTKRWWRIRRGQTADAESVEVPSAAAIDRAETGKGAIRALIISSDDYALDLLSWLLSREGFEVQIARSGQEGIHRAESSPPDVVLVDWMFSDHSGVEVCRRLRSKSETHSVPIAMVTDVADEADRAGALDNGVDDFIIKPFGAREIIAQVYALLRRAKRDVGFSKLRYAGLEMDAANYKVKRDGVSVLLSPLQFKLLRHFMEHPGEVFSREELLISVWGRDAGIDARAVDAQIRRLRVAINKGHDKDLLRTVRVGGYALDGGS